MQTIEPHVLNPDFLDQFLKRMEKFGFSGTILIAQGEKILLDKGYGFRKFEDGLRMNSDTVLSTGSISKQFTSTAIMKLVEIGKLSVNDPLKKYFPNIPQDKSTITIEQLMTHRSGFPISLDDDFNPIDKEEFLKLLFASSLEFEPGSKYSYSNTGYSLLAILIEEVSGISYDTYLDENMLKPLGISNYGWFSDSKWNDDNSVYYYVEGKNTGSIKSWKGGGDRTKQFWHITGNGGVCMSSKDLYLWMRAVFEAKVVSKESIDKMTSPKDDDYGYGWRVVNSSTGRIIRHNGGSDLGVNSVAQYHESIDTYIIIMGNVIQNGFGSAFQFETILNNILEGIEVFLPPEVIDIILNDQKVQTLELDGSNVRISKNDINQWIAGVSGQYLLNQIFELSPNQIQIFENCNKIVEKYGNHIIKQEFNDVFSLTVRKETDQSRINFLKILLAEVEKQFGKILRIKVGGTIPGYDYHAMTTLNFVCENGNPGIPVIWADDSEILGIRPLFSEFCIQFMLGMDKDNQIIGYNGIFNLTFNFSSYLNNG